VNGNNTLEEKIKERIVKGNKAFYAIELFLKADYVQKIKIKVIVVSK
jgi:hypothetical protein